VIFDLTTFCHRWFHTLSLEDIMNTILLVVLILLLLGALPTWPYSANWGYYPSGGLGLILLIVVILLLTGRLPAS
jgi:hypothetical protein